MRDMHNSIDVVSTIAAIVVNNDTEGKGLGVDLAGFNGAEVVFNCGISGDTLSGSVKFIAILQESDDDVDGNYTAVAAADMLGSENFALVDDAAEDAVVQQVGYIGAKRWIRLIVDTTGTHTAGTPMSAVVIRGFPRHAPTTTTPVPAA